MSEAFNSGLPNGQQCQGIWAKSRGAMHVQAHAPVACFIGSPELMLPTHSISSDRQHILGQHESSGKLSQGISIQVVHSLAGCREHRPVLSTVCLQQDAATGPILDKKPLILTTMSYSVAIFCASFGREAP